MDTMVGTTYNKVVPTYFCFMEVNMQEEKRFYVDLVCEREIAEKVKVCMFSVWLGDEWQNLTVRVYCSKTNFYYDHPGFETKSMDEANEYYNNFVFDETLYKELEDDGELPF